MCAECWVGFFFCVSVHFTGKDMHAYLQTTREGALLISSNPEIPLCHNKGASLLKWRGGARFPQVATMKSWQMEAAAVPRYGSTLEIGSHSLWTRPISVGNSQAGLFTLAASQTGLQPELKVHTSPPMLFPPCAFFLPHLNLSWASGCFSAVKASDNKHILMCIQLES